MTAKLIEQITAAFKDQPYTGDDNIVAGNFGEYLEVLRDFKGKRWHELSDDAIAYNRSSLHFLTDEGYRHYLPAYMLFCVKNLQTADMALDATIATLTLSHYRKTEINFKERMSGFTSEQGQAVKAFLEHVHKHMPDLMYPPSKALQAYWSQF